MCFGSENNSPVEVSGEESKERGPNGERVIGMGLRIWNSTPQKAIEMVSGRWEGCNEVSLSWDDFVALRDAMTARIEFLKPMVESGKLLIKLPK